MSTGIKNGKHHTFNIYIAVLFFLFITAPTILSSANGIKNEKYRVIVIDAGHGGKDPGRWVPEAVRKMLLWQLLLKLANIFNRISRM